MFSIENSTEETLKLREHERRVVNYVESILDTQGGMQVMAMEVLCPAPDCVPIETVILILFPKDTNEKSISSSVTSAKIDASSSVQFKILKPLAKVTQGDVELAIPFSLRFGTLASSTGREIRKALFAQLEQCIPPNEDIQSRQWMVQFLQDSLQQYADNNYQQPTDWNEEGLSPSSTDWNEEGLIPSTTANCIERNEATVKESVTTEEMGKISRIGNITIRRPIDEDDKKSFVDSTLRPKGFGGASVHSVVQQRHQTKAVRSLQNGGASLPLTQLSQREHAPGIRRPGCPCCDPESVSNVMDRLLSQF